MSELVEADILQILHRDSEDLVDGGVTLGLQGGRVGLQSDQPQPLGQTGRHKVWEAVTDLQRGYGGHDPVPVARQLDTDSSEVLRTDPGDGGQVVPSTLEERSVDLQTQPAQPVSQAGTGRDWTGIRSGMEESLLVIKPICLLVWPPPSIILTISHRARILIILTPC